MGNLEENAGTITSRLVAARGPAVHEIEQHLVAVLDDGVVAMARDVGDGTDAARIMLPPRIVQPAPLGRPTHALLKRLRGPVDPFPSYRSK